MSVPDLVVAGSLTVDNVRTAQGDLLPPRPGGNVIFAASALGCGPPRSVSSRASAPTIRLTRWSDWPRADSISAASPASTHRIA